MKKETAKILRANDVELTGSLQLNSPTIQQAAPESRLNQTDTKPQVQIIQNTDEFAVIEVICSCGQTTHIKCEYA
ncbi:MAG: hypothetical protein JW804_06435 [Sedimentisphaerales bacterium]|nr:hypothetical protein [Sedimentisphaerales bacterium]